MKSVPKLQTHQSSAFAKFTPCRLQANLKLAAFAMFSPVYTAKLSQRGGYQGKSRQTCLGKLRRQTFQLVHLTPNSLSALADTPSHESLSHESLSYELLSCFPPEWPHELLEITSMVLSCNWICEIIVCSIEKLQKRKRYGLAIW